EPIGHTAVPGDPPWHHAVVQPGHSVISLKRHVPIFGDFFPRRLPLPDLVDASGKNCGLVAVPIPAITESGMRHALRRAFDLSAVPRLAAIGGNFHAANGAAAGPGQPADLVKSLAGQLLAAGWIG